jgi:hypothetical protein
MNVETGNEAVQFPEKEYINGIAVAVWFTSFLAAWYMLYPERTSHQIVLVPEKQATCFIVPETPKSGLFST